MRFPLLATDYDGTLAHDGEVAPSTVEAMRRFAATGRRLMLVTGRELPQLLEVCPEIDLFEMVVAENGALLYVPATKEEHLLSDPPPAALVESLQRRGVSPMSVGRGIVALWEPHETAALKAIQECGLEWQVIFNKGAVMLLPSGVNKASGLAAALARLQLSRHNVVGVGDAENDHAFLQQCEVAVAVANALPSVKQEADLVTVGDHGEGVVELMEMMVSGRLSQPQTTLDRHDLAVGMSGDQLVRLPVYGRTVLVCGPSGSGKSTFVTQFVETLVEQGYQFCLVDPEGDYQTVDGAVTLGGASKQPDEEDILQLLSDPSENVIADMTDLPIPDRPRFFLSLLPRLLEMRTRTGRPHWMVLDEAHHLMPSEWRPSDEVMPSRLHSTLLITVHADLLAPSLLEQVDLVVAVGNTPRETLAEFCKGVRQPMPGQLPELAPGEVLLWNRSEGKAPRAIRPFDAKTQRVRHRRKYAEGKLAPEQCFYFRGPKNELNLCAENLIAFLNLGEGVDDATWLYHLKKGDYTEWFREVISDAALVELTQQLEGEREIDLDEGRARLRQAVESRYYIAPPKPVSLPGAL